MVEYFYTKIILCMQIGMNTVICTNVNKDVLIFSVISFVTNHIDKNISNIIN